MLDPSPYSKPIMEKGRAIPKICIVRQPGSRSYLKTAGLPAAYSDESVKAVVLIAYYHTKRTYIFEGGSSNYLDPPPAWCLLVTFTHRRPKNKLFISFISLATFSRDIQKYTCTAVYRQDEPSIKLKRLLVSLFYFISFNEK